MNEDPRLNDTIFCGREALYLPPEDMGKPEDEQVCLPVASLNGATLITSKMTTPEEDRTHMPVFDLDIPFDDVRLIRSASGNTHLLINKPMTWENYVTLLKVMVTVGLLEKGWVEKSIRQGKGRLRLPGVPKLQPTRGFGGYDDNQEV